MKILVIAATQAEILPFLQLPEQQRQDMDTLITGVGMVATAFALGKRLAQTQYDLLLNVGIAGSFNRAIALGEVVSVYQDTFAELGVEDGERFMDSETLDLAKHTFYSTPPPGCLKPGKLRHCNAITVNRVHGNELTINAIVHRLQPDIESMEGAAVLYAGQRLDIPTVQVRTISNYVERRNKANWQIPLAIENLNQWLADFTFQLPEF